MYSGEEYEKLMRMVFLPPPLRWNASPGTNATFFSMRALQDLGCIHAFRQDTPQEHAALWLAPGYPGGNISSIISNITSRRSL